MQSIKSEEKTKQKVLDAIQEADPKDLSIHEIAGITKLSRETVSKYVGILEAEGKIKLARRMGKAKLYLLSDKN
jgi:response regulator of citrate/malate metabolism